MLSSIKGYLIGAAIVLPLLGFMYWQNTNLTAKNEANLQIMQQQDLAIKAKDKINEKILTTIDKWDAAQQELIQKMEELKNVSEEANKETRRLTDVFSKHNLTKLAARKPSLIEKRINRGTVAAFRVLECASGSTDRSCSADDKGTGEETSPAESGTD